MQTSTAVFAKTPKAYEEIHHRIHRLSARQRRVLILLDGQKTLSSIAEVVPMNELEEVLPLLVRDNFVQVKDSAMRSPEQSEDTPLPARAKALLDTGKLQEIKNFMISSAQTCLGLLAADLVQRIEKARDEVQLQSLVGQWHMALRESRQGPNVADKFLEHVRTVLGQV